MAAAVAAAAALVEHDPRPVDAGLVDLIVEEYTGKRDENGRLTGQGSAKFVGGHTYEGSFLDGMMHGDGTYVWSDGVKYVGGFKHNQVTGRGRYEWPDGSWYVGDVLGGKRHGNGTFHCGGDSAVFYTGEWKDGKRHGKGIIQYNETKTSYYDGEWAADKRQGQGLLVYPSGNTYEGLWLNDMKHGHGVMNWKTRQEVYTGDWQEDHPHGLGSHVWQEIRPRHGTTQKQLCNRYEGFYRRGLRHGNGSFFYSNGSKYEGEWCDNQKHGRGVFTFEDGELYEGNFVHDRMADPRRRGGKDERIGRMAVLRIEDLLADKTEEEQEKTMQFVGNTLLRWNSDLKQVYQFYSVVGSSSVENMFTLTTNQFWKFLRDCHITSNKLSLATVNRILTTLRRRHAQAIHEAQLKREQLAQTASNRRNAARRMSMEARGNGHHDPGRSILYREFLEALVRIAHFKYGDASGDLPHAVQHLLQQVKNSAMKESTDDFRRWLATPEIKAVFAEHEHLLREVFLSYAQLDQSTASAAHADKSINVREFLVLLRDTQVLTNTFGMSDAMKIFLKANYEWDSDAFAPVVDVLDAACENLESEMIYTEFLEALARVAYTLFGKTTVRKLERMRSLSRKQTPVHHSELKEPDGPVPLKDRLEALIELHVIKYAKILPGVRIAANSAAQLQHKLVDSEEAVAAAGAGAGAGSGVTA